MRRIAQLTFALATSTLMSWAATVVATPYDFSYSFASGDVVTGSFSGTANGNLITGLTNISAYINGAPFRGNGNVFNQGWIYNQQLPGNPGTAVASFDGTQNAFSFLDFNPSGPYDPSGKIFASNPYFGGATSYAAFWNGSRSVWEGSGSTGSTAPYVPANWSVTAHGGTPPTPPAPRLFGIAIGQNDYAGIRGDLGAQEVFTALQLKPSWATIGNPSAPIVINGNPNHNSATNKFSYADISNSNPGGAAEVIINQLKAQVQSIGNNITDNDTFVFYASTHGLQSIGINTGNAERPDASGNTSDEWLSFLFSDDQLAELFNNSTWDGVRKIFLFDVCHGGGFLGGGDEGDLDRLTNTMIIASAAENELAYSWGAAFGSAAGRGVFTDLALLPALTQASLTVGELRNQVYASWQSSPTIVGLYNTPLPILGLPGETALFQQSTPMVFISADLDERSVLIAAQVPEPGTLALVLSCIPVLICGRRVVLHHRES